jgi:hypothetical protein
MEQFCYLAEYNVLICKPCGRAVAPTHLHTHLKGHSKPKTQKKVQIQDPSPSKDQKLLRKDLHYVTKSVRHPAHIRLTKPMAVLSPTRLAEQDAHCIAVRICSHDIEVTISVEVAYCNTVRTGPYAELGLRLEAP